MISRKKEKNKSINILLVLAAVGIGIFSYNYFWKKNSELTKPNIDTGVTQELSAKTEGSFSLESDSNARKQPSEAIGHTYSAKEEMQWKIIGEILLSKNDNDPRIDQELKTVSEELKTRIKDEYRKLPAENRNGRGFLAFLIARDFKSHQDVDFMKSIFEEKACLSLSDCSSVAEEDPHLDSINNTSLNYPQMVTLYQLKKKLEDEADFGERQSLRAELEQLLREARQFPAPGIEARVSEIEELLRK